MGWGKFAGEQHLWTRSLSPVPNQRRHTSPPLCYHWTQRLNSWPNSGSIKNQLKRRLEHLESLSVILCCVCSRTVWKKLVRSKHFALNVGVCDYFKASNRFCVVFTSVLSIGNSAPADWSFYSVMTRWAESHMQEIKPTARASRLIKATEKQSEQMPQKRKLQQMTSAAASVED